MSVRISAAALAGAAALVATLAPSAAAMAGAAHWRYYSEYSSIAACQNIGRSLVARHAAREYRCENSYTEAGVPVLDLYVR